MVSCVFLVVRIIQLFQDSKSAGSLARRCPSGSTPICSQYLGVSCQSHMLGGGGRQSHVPVPKPLGPCDDFDRPGFVVRWTPTNLPKFLPSLRGKRELSSVGGKRERMSMMVCSWLEATNLLEGKKTLKLRGEHQEGDECEGDWGPARHDPLDRWRSSF